MHYSSSLYAGKLITLEAMSGLSKVLLYLDKKNVHLLVVYIFMKIKPFLESVNFSYILSVWVKSPVPVMEESENEWQKML